MYIQIMCSNCGHRSRKYGYAKYPMTDPADEIVKSGWNSFGSAFYCKNCAQSWESRNGKDRPLWGEDHTRICVYREMVSDLKDALEYAKNGEYYI